MTVSKFTGWGLVGEAVFPLIALPMWAQGTPKDEIIDMLTWGAFGLRPRRKDSGKMHLRLEELTQRLKN